MNGRTDVKTQRKPLDEHLLRVARRAWAWEDLIVFPLVRAVLYFSGGTSTGVAGGALIVVALVTVQQRIQQRVDAVVQLVERIEGRT